MINYKSLIKKNLLNKYKNSTKFDKNFLNSFFLHRENILKKINLFKIIYHENDHTFSDLLSLNKKKDFNNKKVIEYYKKFETNLKLKKKYNRYFIKKTNHETSFASYVYLGMCISNNKSLNSLQKMNCIIKIIDKISLNLTLIDIETSFVLKNLIKKENFFFKKLIK